MATTTVSRSHVFIGGSPVRLSWGAIIGGAFVSLAFWILLLALGMALGLSSLNFVEGVNAKSAGIGGGLWILISGLIALFIGGVVAARTAGPVDRPAALFHGAVLWGLSTVAVIFFVWSGVGAFLGGLANVGKSAVSAGTNAVQQGALSEAGNALGLDFNDLLAPVNQKLSQEGKPQVTADQLQAATQDVLSTAVRQGRLDRDTLVISIAENTNLSRADAEDVAGRIETQFNQHKGQVISKVQTGATQVAHTSGKVFWGVFITLLLDLVAACLGAIVALGGRVEPAPTVPETGTGIPVRREVYP